MPVQLGMREDLSRVRSRQLKNCGYHQTLRIEETLFNKTKVMKQSVTRDYKNIKKNLNKEMD